MLKTNKPIMAIPLILLASSLACSLLSGGGTQATEAPAQVGSQPSEAAPVQATLEISVPQEPAQTEAPAEAEQPAAYDTGFPMPDDVQNFTKIGSDQVNFQTGMSMQAVTDFYRAQLTAQGLKERGLLTVIGDTTFSMVFDGDPEGAVVVQGVDLGDGTTNVNIRHEDV
jgi:hypothetical protein